MVLTALTTEKFLTKGLSGECTVPYHAPSSSSTPGSGRGDCGSFDIGITLSQYPVQASASFPLRSSSSNSFHERSKEMCMSATNSKHIVEGKKRSREEIELIALQQGAKKGG